MEHLMSSAHPTTAQRQTNLLLSQRRRSIRVGLAQSPCRLKKII